MDTSRLTPERVRRAIARRTPRRVLQSRRDLARDRALARTVAWPRVLFVAGLPKAGTTWIEQLLGEVPGYALRPYRDPDRCTFVHDVCDEVFESLPDGVLSILKLHTTAAPANLDVIRRHVERFVVMYRDLRDQCVSRYHDVITRSYHPDHELYRSSSHEEAMAHCIDVIVEHYVPWIAEWRAVAAHDERVAELRYEDLRTDTPGELARVLRHWRIDLPPAEVEAIVGRVAERTRFGLTDKTLASRNTARRGVVGGWRDEFTPEHVERFKAGAGELLVELGYERDDTWA